MSKELSEQDKDILAKEGAALPEPVRKSNQKRKRQTEEKHQPDGPQTTNEEKWQEVKKYLDPNPQLRECKSSEEKVCLLLLASLTNFYQVSCV